MEKSRAKSAITEQNGNNMTRIIYSLLKKRTTSSCMGLNAQPPVEEPAAAFALKQISNTICTCRILRVEGLLPDLTINPQQSWITACR
ncbi:MAG: hypothetical protein L3J26_09095 [Candidatus Polarisedimenticolaceae bacterium]|nr:hypothetical protein [Candidatus Polarisedimenticolaceae bacterium]